MFYFKSYLKACTSVLDSLHSIVHVSVHMHVMSALISLHSSVHVSFIVVSISYMYRLIELYKA